LQAALAQVEESRGKRGRITVSPQLRLYEDSRRFLAVQMADSRERGYALPADEAELAGLVLRGELVELPAMTDDYVLYEPGTAVQEDSLTHFDVETETSVRLLPSLQAWHEEKARLERAERGPGRAAREAGRELARLEPWYDDASRRERLFEEHADLMRLAREWEVDLGRPEDRSRFHVRLTSCLRPDAAALLGTLARAYRERFGRHLPVSSLTRTQHYQRQLRRVNKNATNVEFPPHTTGMAFDISYRFMPAEEQNFLIDQIARMKNAGKVEALREPRNSIHVFVFRHGPPAEDAVEAFMQLVDENRSRPKAPRRRRNAGRA
jgi:hypothetical protein